MTTVLLTNNTTKSGHLISAICASCHNLPLVPLRVQTRSSSFEWLYLAWCCLTQISESASGLLAPVIDVRFLWCALSAQHENRGDFSTWFSTRSPTLTLPISRTKLKNNVQNLMIHLHINTTQTYGCIFGTFFDLVCKNKVLALCTLFLPKSFMLLS